MIIKVISMNERELHDCIDFIKRTFKIRFVLLNAFVLLILPTLIMFVCFERERERKIVATIAVCDQSPLDCNTISLPFPE